MASHVYGEMGSDPHLLDSAKLHHAGQFQRQALLFRSKKPRHRLGNIEFVPSKNEMQSGERFVHDDALQDRKQKSEYIYK